MDQRPGVGLARYDRLDPRPATEAGGSIHAWAAIGRGPAGWHPIRLPEHTTGQAHSPQPGGRPLPTTAPAGQAAGSRAAR